MKSEKKFCEWNKSITFITSPDIKAIQTAQKQNSKTSIVLLTSINNQWYHFPIQSICTSSCCGEYESPGHTQIFLFFVTDLNAK